MGGNKYGSIRPFIMGTIPQRAPCPHRFCDYADHRHNYNPAQKGDIQPLEAGI